MAWAWVKHEVRVPNEGQKLPELVSIRAEVHKIIFVEAYLAGEERLQCRRRVYTIIIDLGL